jgi:hypothetical protein
MQLKNVLISFPRLESMETTDMGPNESKACPSEEIGVLGVMLPKSLLMTVTFNNNTSTFAFIIFFFLAGCGFFYFSLLVKLTLIRDVLWRMSITFFYFILECLGKHMFVFSGGI